MNETVESRVALITGASRGIGAAVAAKLGEAGHRVVVNYARSAGAADEVVARITEAGGEAISIQADVSDETQVTDLFEEVTGALGPVTILVNNAGITRDNLLMRMSAADFDEVIAVNLRSAFLCTKTALRGMVRARWGRIVSVASVAGVTGNAGQANYAASKAGLIGFAKSVAKEYGARGITSNVVAPGFITTDMTAELGEDVINKAIASISAGRFGDPDEVAAVVGFLASEDAGYVTGQVLSVDGGISL